MLRTAIVCFLALGVVSSNGIRRQRQYPLGHMEPLGHQRPMEGRVERVPSGLTPFEFFSRYVETATPVVLTRAINGTVPHSEWTDMYLKLVGCQKMLPCCFRIDHVTRSRIRSYASHVMLLHAPGLILDVMK